MRPCAMAPSSDAARPRRRSRPTPSSLRVRRRPRHRCDRPRRVAGFPPASSAEVFPAATGRWIVSTDASGHLEREFDSHPAGPRHRLARPRRYRRAGHAGDQMLRQPVPDPALFRARLRGRPCRVQPVERCGDRLPGRPRRRADRLRRPAHLEQQTRRGRDGGSPRPGRHLRGRAGVESVRAQWPHPGRSALPLQAGLACRTA